MPVHMNPFITKSSCHDSRHFSKSRSGMRMECGVRQEGVGVVPQVKVWCRCRAPSCSWKGVPSLSTPGRRKRRTSSSSRCEHLERGAFSAWLYGGDSSGSKTQLERGAAPTACQLQCLGRAESSLASARRFRAEALGALEAGRSSNRRRCGHPSLPQS